MGFALIGVSLLLAVGAAIMFVASRGTLHEMEAFILWLIASVLFTGGAIVLALADLRRRLDQLVKPSDPL
jgi:hypothetical protein